MNRKSQLILVLLSAVAICSVICHVAVRSLRIKSTYASYQRYGPADAAAKIQLHGSSLAYDGLNWDQLSAVLGSPVQSWATAGSTPSEWELMAAKAPESTQTFIVISPYDLNEHYFCDFRANIAPVTQTIADLHRIGADWPLCKRVLSQYAVVAARTLFPTVGRSDGVLVGIRAKLQGLLGRDGSDETLDAPKFGTEGASTNSERLSEWSEARVTRRLVLMRNASHEVHAFHGLKNLALQRLFTVSLARGRVTAIVMPVSPVYKTELLGTEGATRFERLLEELHAAYPQVSIQRLDQNPVLHDDAMFSDLVHLNMYGQQIATSMLVEKLEHSAKHP